MSKMQKISEDVSEHFERISKEKSFKVIMKAAEKCDAIKGIEALMRIVEREEDLSEDALNTLALTMKMIFLQGYTEGNNASMEHLLETIQEDTKTGMSKIAHIKVSKKDIAEIEEHLDKLTGGAISKIKRQMKGDDEKENDNDIESVSDWLKKKL
jgi:hypothetical protein